MPCQGNGVDADEVGDKNDFVMRHSQCADNCVRLAWQTGMFAKAVLCQEQITAGALRANEGGRQSRSDHLRSRRGRL